MSWQLLRHLPTSYRDASGVDHPLSPLATISGLVASLLLVNTIAAVGRRLWITYAQPLLLALPKLAAARAKRVPGRQSALSVLQLVTQHTGSAVSEIGVDVGGTLAKFVFADSHSPILPDRFGVVEDGAPGGRTHHELRLRVCRKGLRKVGDGDTLRPEEACTLQFLSGQSSHFEALLASTASLVASPDVRRSSSRWWRGSAAASATPTADPRSPRGHRRSSSSASASGGGANADVGCSSELPAENEVRRVAATGGGAHKLRQWAASQRLSHSLASFVLPEFEFNIVPEMEAAIEGLLVLHALQPPNELFTLGEGDADACVPTAWPADLFPFLLVSMGSGVSVLRVDGVRDPLDTSNAPPRVQVSQPGHHHPMKHASTVGAMQITRASSSCASVSASAAASGGVVTGVARTRSSPEEAAACSSSSSPLKRTSPPPPTSPLAGNVAASTLPPPSPSGSSLIYKRVGGARALMPPRSDALGALILMATAL